VTLARRTLQLLLVAVCLAFPAGALADADPASDVLLGAPAFYPFQPPVSQTLQSQLEQELAQLQKKRLSLKVAIIASPVDLGAIPNLFGQPQTYATFLGREISFQHPQALLVVMPAGFGVYGTGTATALAGLKVNTTGASNGLTQSAILAVQRIAQAAGKTVTTGGSAGRGSGSGGPSPLAIAGIVAGLVVLALAIAALRFRRTGLRRPGG
jgi:hypothetical protein